MISRQFLRTHTLALEGGDLALKRQTFRELRVPPEEEWVGAPAEAAVALVGALRDHLRGGSEMTHFQKEAAAVLGNMGGHAGVAVPQLVELLRDGVPDAVREAAATALGKIGKLAGPAATPLARLVVTARAALSVRAARALGHIGSATEEVRSALLRLWLVPQQVEGGRAQAAIALCQLGVGAPGLLESLTKDLVLSREVPHRRAAAEALAWCDKSGPGVVPALLTAALGDKNEGVREVAQAGLDRMNLSPEEAAQACADQLGATPYAEAALKKSGPKAVPALVKAMASKQAGVRARASRALGGIGAEAADAAPALEDALGDADPEVRLAAAKGLWDVTGSPDRAVPALVGLLRTKGRGRPEEADARRMFLQTVMEALGRIGPAAAAAVPVLTALTTDDNRHVRETALDALRKIRRA